MILISLQHQVVLAINKCIKDNFVQLEQLGAATWVKKNFPLFVFLIFVVHLIIHLPVKVKLSGLVQYWWMYHIKMLALLNLHK